MVYRNSVWVELYSRRKMKWWLTELNKIGYGALIHTIGDAGVREFKCD